MHFAIHGNIAAEVIVARANHQKENMGLATWRNAPHGKILKGDVTVAKNYLSQLELTDLNEIVNMYLDYAERQARRRIPMMMADWVGKLDAFLEFNDEKVLKEKGKIKMVVARAFAESEYEKFRAIQDKKYISDFDRLILESKNL